MVGFDVRIKVVQALSRGRDTQRCDIRERRERGGMENCIMIQYGLLGVLGFGMVRAVCL